MQNLKEYMVNESSEFSSMENNPLIYTLVIPKVLNGEIDAVKKDETIKNVIGVTELYYFAGIIKRQSFETFQTYLVICVIYFILTFTITRLLRWVERKLDGGNSYVIFGSQSDSAAEIHISREA